MCVAAPCVVADCWGDFYVCALCPLEECNGVEIISNHMVMTSHSEHTSASVGVVPGYV